MYNEFYGFSEAPFKVTPDPKFLFLTPDHREALASMVYGIQERKGFISITGEVGTGKTTLIYTLLKQIDERVKTVFIFQTILSFEELLKKILQELDVPMVEKGRTALLRLLNEYLIERLTRDETLAIIIDEAQNLSKEVMEGLRMLSNLETPQSKLLQIILVGQPELKDKLDSEDMRQLKQRVEIRRTVRPLTREECSKYVDHRLNLVGSNSQKLFTQEALSLICDHSRGIPRTINIICDNALLIGYGMNQKVIDGKILREVLEDMGIAIREKPVSSGPAPAERPGPSPSPAGTGDRIGPESDHVSLLSSVLVEFIPYLKKTLDAVRTQTESSVDRSEDRELRKSLNGSLSEEIQKIDLVLNGLLNYIHVNRPARKPNTVHLILDRVLGEYKGQLEQKKIKILKKFKEDLPETVLQDEALNYIIHSILQYALLSASPGGTIGVLTRSSDSETEDRRDVEIILVLNEYKEGETIPGIPEKEGLDLFLPLLKEIVQKSGGRMTFEADERQMRKFISLRFPAEKRRMVSFAPSGR